MTLEEAMADRTELIFNFDGQKLRITGPKVEILYTMMKAGERPDAISINGRTHLFPLSAPNCDEDLG